MSENMPSCTVCNRSGTGVEFPMFPKSKGMKFGDICSECDKNG